MKDTKSTKHSMTNLQIKRFVQETLGCSCPEEVFNKIDFGTGVLGPRSKRIDFGNRLLIYVLDATDVSDLRSSVVNALRTGVAERDTEGFNRFRLVVVPASIPTEIKAAAEDAFASSSLRDDKTQLHVVALKDVEHL